jgi:hypothetical protein
VEAGRGRASLLALPFVSPVSELVRDGHEPDHSGHQEHNDGPSNEDDYFSGIHESSPFISVGSQTSRPQQT